MRLSKLISHLNDRLAIHGDVDVVSMWEGIVVDIKNSKIYLSMAGKLYIDVDQDDYYKKVYAVNQKEGVE